MKTLEQEFMEYVEHHKYETIVAALMTLEDEGIYDTPLLREYKNPNFKGDIKAVQVGEDLYDRANNGEEELYDRIYEMCWRKVRRRINDQKAYRIGIDYDEDLEMKSQ